MRESVCVLQCALQCVLQCVLQCESESTVRKLVHTRIHTYTQPVSTHRRDNGIPLCTASLWCTASLSETQCTTHAVCVAPSVAPHTLQHTETQCTTETQSETQCTTHVRDNMGWLRLVGSLKLYVSFAKEPYKRDNILTKRPIILRSLLIVATP